MKRISFWVALFGLVVGVLAVEFSRVGLADASTAPLEVASVGARAATVPNAAPLAQPALQAQANQTCPYPGGNCPLPDTVTCDFFVGVRLVESPAGTFGLVFDRIDPADCDARLAPSANFVSASLTIGGTAYAIDETFTSAQATSFAGQPVEVVLVVTSLDGTLTATINSSGILS